MPKFDSEKQQRLEQKFRKLDRNGDGTLNLSELRGLLKKGNPQMQDAEIARLFQDIDRDGNNYVDFREFLRYIYEKERNEQQSQDEQNLDWTQAEHVFWAFGRENGLNAYEFAKLCTDCRLHDGRHFRTADADLLFSRCCPRGMQSITFHSFQNLLQEVARAKRMQTQDLVEHLASFTGPVHVGTVADEDAAALLARPDRLTGNLDDRHARLQRASQVAPDPGESAFDWELVLSTFQKYKRRQRIGVAEFKHMLEDVNVIDDSFSTTDCDLIFFSVKGKGNDRLNFEEFKDAVRRIAHYKGCPLGDIQGAIMSSAGPSHGYARGSLRSSSSR